MVAAQDLHQLVLRRVDILKFIDHDVFQPLLPLEPDILMRAEDIEGELDQIVVVKREALLFLIEIAVENDILCACGLLIFFLQRVEGQGDHVLVILRPLLELQHLNHVARVGERHVAQRQPALVVDDLEHGVNIAVVEHQKALGIADGVAVLLQDGDAEAGILVAGQIVDALAHFISRLVGERHAKKIPRQDAKLRHKIGEPARQRPRLAGACARDDAHEPFSR